MKVCMSSKKGNNGSVAKIQGHYYNNNDDSCFQEINEMAPISIKACKGNQLLITLTVLDTWCEKAGDGAWFAIKVNNKIVARGLYSVAMDGQRVPITLQAMVDVTSLEEDVTIRAMWCNCEGTSGRACCIGEFSESILTVLVNDWNVVNSKLEEMTKNLSKIPGLK